MIRKLRGGAHGQIILNMGLSLAGLYIFFLIGGHVTVIPVLCGLSAALLHYFMLVFFAWTAVEALWLYVKLVKVFGMWSFENMYILKAGIPAWGECYNYVHAHPPIMLKKMQCSFSLYKGIPLLIVAISVGLGYRYYINDYL
jgi:hypothetical protein